MGILYPWFFSEKNPWGVENLLCLTVNQQPPKTKHATLYSSASDEWATPQHLFDRLHAQYGFTLDPCSTHQNAKCTKHYTRAEDGLSQSWADEVVWMNPPYGRGIGAWVRKAYEESLRGATAVCLLPGRTDTKWFWDWCCYGTVEFVRGRLRFGAATNSAPFPSILVYFGAKRGPSALGVGEGFPYMPPSMSPQSNAKGACTQLYLPELPSEQPECRQQVA